MSKANLCCFAEGVSGSLGFYDSSGRSSIICFNKSYVSNLCSSSTLRFPAILSGSELSSWEASSIYILVSVSCLSVYSIFWRNSRQTLLWVSVSIASTWALIFAISALSSSSSLFYFFCSFSKVSL